MSGYNKEQLDRLDPIYMINLGLNRPPFTVEHHDNFLYLDAERKQRLDMLQHLTQYSNLLLIVTGERGIGKSSLMQRFIKQASDDWSVCEVQANAMMDAHQLLASIATGYGLQNQGQPASVLQETLYQYLATLQHDGHTPILIIDDAHELPQDALETLFNLADAETSEGNLLRIILFCEPQIEVMLESPAIQPLRERITHTMEIPPLSEEQTAEYLKHRLAVSGFVGTSPFQPKDIRRIYKVSHGIPAKINELAHLQLSGVKGSMVEDPGKLPEEFTRLSYSKKRLAAGLVVVSLVVTAIVFQDNINRLFEEPATTRDNEQITQAPVIPPVSQVPVPATVEQQTVEPELPQSPQSETITSDLDIKPASSADMVEPSTVSQDNQDTGTVVRATTSSEKEPAVDTIKTFIRGVLPDPVTGSSETQQLLINGEGFTHDTRISVGWSGNNNRKVLDATQVFYENSNQLRINIAVGTKADTWTIIASNDKHGTSKPFAFKVTAAPVKGLQSAEWINKQTSANFTLQLLGTYNRDALTKFTQQHKLEKDVAWFKTTRNSRDWYTLIYGNHPSRQAAQDSISQLSTALQQSKPWIRKFEDIQRILHQQQVSQATTIKQTSNVSRSPSVPPSGKPLDLTTHAAWLWSQNPGHYTLQLLGSQSLESMLDYIRKHNLGNKAVYYRTRRNGREWFVLLYGTYPDRDQAHAAINQLPASLRQSKPWPRRFSDIHNELSSQ